MFQAYNSNPQGMFILLLVGMIVPVILVILRFASRKIERVGWWWDDYLAGLSLLLFVGGFWADLQIVRWSSNEQGPFLIRVYINNVLYPLIVSTTKISGLLLYVLHFGYEKWPKRIAYTLMALVVCWCIAAVATSVVQCLPLAAAWTTPTNSPAQCFQRPLLFEAVGIADAAMNLLVLLLPLPKIFRLDLRSFGPVVSLLQVYVLALLYVQTLSPSFITNIILPKVLSPVLSSASTTPHTFNPSPRSPLARPNLSHLCFSGPNSKSPSVFKPSACQPPCPRSSRCSLAPSKTPKSARGGKCIGV